MDGQRSRAAVQEPCFTGHHLTFFKVTNSFSAQGRRDSSSSYLQQGEHCFGEGVEFARSLLGGGALAASGGPRCFLLSRSFCPPPHPPTPAGDRHCYQNIS